MYPVESKGAREEALITFNATLTFSTVMYMYSLAHKQVADMGLQFKLSSLRICSCPPSNPYTCVNNGYSSTSRKK